MILIFISNNGRWDDEMAKIRKIETDEEIKIFSDPYRMKIINTYIKAHKPLTVKGVADLMGEVPAKVHYHVKKLIAINILKLDHTEVINGITAKYYLLTTKHFVVSYHAISDHKGLFDSTTNMILSVIDEFKDDIVDGARFIKEHEIEYTDTQNGYITKEVVHLNEDEYEELESTIQKLIEKYKEPKEGKRSYDLFTGWTRKHK